MTPPSSATATPIPPSSAHRATPRGAAQCCVPQAAWHPTLRLLDNRLAPRASLTHDSNKHCKLAEQLAPPRRTPVPRRQRRATACQGRSKMHPLAPVENAPPCGRGLECGALVLRSRGRRPRRSSSAHAAAGWVRSRSVVCELGELVDGRVGTQIAVEPLEEILVVHRRRSLQPTLGGARGDPPVDRLLQRAVRPQIDDARGRSQDRLQSRARLLGRHVLSGGFRSVARTPDQSSVGYLPDVYRASPCWRPLPAVSDGARYRRPPPLSAPPLRR